MVNKLNSIYVVPGYTFFYWGFTIPKRDQEEFKKYFKLKEGSLVKKINLKIKGKTYPAYVRIVRQTSPKYTQREVLQIFYDREYATLKALRKLFIYSYATTIDKKKPKLKEIMELVHEGGLSFKVKPFAKQETDFDSMFQSMEDRNLFGYWKDAKEGGKKSFFISHAKKWLPVSDLPTYKNVNNCIYVLYNSKKCTIYVGKANSLADRLKPGRQHQGMDGDWDKFMYFEIDPEYSDFIEQIEAFVMRTYSALLPNNFGIKPLEDEKPTLVNKQLRKK